VVFLTGLSLWRRLSAFLRCRRHPRLYPSSVTRILTLFLTSKAIGALELSHCPRTRLQQQFGPKPVPFVYGLRLRIVALSFRSQQEHVPTRATVSPSFNSRARWASGASFHRSETGRHEESMGNSTLSGIGGVGAQGSWTDEDFWNARSPTAHADFSTGLAHRRNDLLSGTSRSAITASATSDIHEFSWPSRRRGLRFWVLQTSSTITIAHLFWPATA